MMAETTYYRRETILVRDLHAQGRFGTLFYSEGEYWHDNLEEIMFADGARTWRYGLPPMHYPTHSTAFLTAVTGERMAGVQCIGWGDDSPILKDNVYDNPFWNEVALFTTDRGHASRMLVGWKVGHPGVERASWFGTGASYVMPTGFGQSGSIGESHKSEPMPAPNFHERLPEPLRQDSGHGGSHPFIAHEFISALLDERRPAVDVYEAVAYTAPGIVAHQSALRGGEMLQVPDFGRAEG
jgi:hypothetical protein